MMLSIIWGILKVIGIILLAILVLLIAALLLILFVPLRYEFSASGKYHKESEDPPDYLVKARVSWLLRLVSIRLLVDGTGAKLKLRIFGIPLGGGRKKHSKAERMSGEQAQKSLKKEKRARRGEERESAEEESSGSESPAEDLPKEKFPGETCSEKTASGESRFEETLSGELKTASAGEETAPDEREKETESKQTGEEKGFLKKLAALIHKIRHFFSELFQNLRGTFEKIRVKIKRISDMAGEIRDFLGAEENREAFRYLRGEAGKLFRQVLPRKLSGEIRFGLEDPAATGKVLMALGIAYPLFGKRLSVTPVFENKLYVEGSLFFKGRIRAFSLLIIGIRVWFNQKFRGLLKRGRELKEQLGRA